MLNQEKMRTKKPEGVEKLAPNVSLRQVDELPAKYRKIFSPYKSFNRVQSTVFDCLLATDSSVVVSAPTGSGKTTLFELAIVRLLETRREGSPSSTENKIVYLAPVKALCSERFNDWVNKFRPLGLRTAEVTGDSTDPVELKIIENFDLIVTTPEKWDSMTRRWKDHAGLVQLIHLFLIDEVHLLNEDRRGATLEAVVARMKAVEEALKLGGKESSVRFVAVSATIPNIDDVALWLGTPGHHAKSFEFDESARPVALKKVVLGYPLRSKDKAYTFDLNLTYKLKQVIISHAAGKPTLIFCSSRKSVQQTCTILKKIVTFNFTQEQKQKLDEVAEMILDNNLRGLIKHGLAYHHAGLVYNDRHSIEEVFRSGFLPVLVSTSTLAIGVNLPAHLVIIKSTEQYICGDWQPYSESQILQMMGRAGRPQFDTSATAVIMTRDSSKAKYEKLVSGEELIESSLHNHLIEHLNSEIVLGTITDIALAMNWLRSTFLYVRAMKNPKYYGIPPNLTEREIESKLQAMTMRELHALEKYELIRTSNFAYTVEPTENGKLMARYYIAFETMKIFMKIEGTENLPALLDHLTHCHEFHDVQLRRHERPILNSLNRNKDKPTIRFPLPGKITNKAAKANVLIQAVLGALQISDPGLQQESIKVMRIAERLLRGMTLFLSRKTHFQALASALTLQKCTVVKMWENSAQMCRQLPGIGPALGALLEAAGKGSFNDIINADPRTLERIINRQPPMGNTLQEAASRMPQYDIDIEIKERYSTITAHVRLLNAEEVQYGNMLHTFALLISAENQLLKREVVSDQTLVTNNGSYKVQTYAGKILEEVTDITVTLISNGIVGVDIQTKVEPASARRPSTATSTEGFHGDSENRPAKDSKTYFFEKYSFVPSRAKKLTHSTEELPLAGIQNQENTDESSTSSVDATQNVIPGNRTRETVKSLSGKSVRDEGNLSSTRDTGTVKEADREIIELSSDDSITAAASSHTELTTRLKNREANGTGRKVEGTVFVKETGHEKRNVSNEPAWASDGRTSRNTSQSKDDLGFDIDNLLSATLSDTSKSENHSNERLLPSVGEKPEKPKEFGREASKAIPEENDTDDSPSINFDVDDLFDSSSSVNLPENDYCENSSSNLIIPPVRKEDDVLKFKRQTSLLFSKPPESMQPPQIPIKCSGDRIVKSIPIKEPPEEFNSEEIHVENPVVEERRLFESQKTSFQIGLPDGNMTLSQDSLDELCERKDDLSYIQQSSYDLTEAIFHSSSEDLVQLTSKTGNPSAESDGSNSMNCYIQLLTGEPPNAGDDEAFKFNEYPKKLRLSYEEPTTPCTVATAPKNWLQPSTNAFLPGPSSLKTPGFSAVPNFAAPQINFASQPASRRQKHRHKFTDVFFQDKDRMENSALQNFPQLYSQEPMDKKATQSKREEMIWYSQGHNQLPRAVLTKKRRSPPTPEAHVEDSGVSSSVCTSLSGLLAIHGGYGKSLNRNDVG